MPSPDARPYVDLTLFDVDATSIFLDALERARQALPEWEPRVGQIELTLLEAIAFEVAETVGAINRLPNSMTEILLHLFGIERQAGTFPTSSVTITSVDGDETRVVPANTRMFYSGTNGNVLVFETDEDVTLNAGLAAGKATGEVTITGVSASDSYNGIETGTALTLLSPNPYIASVVLDSAIQDGVTTETDTAYFNRAMLRLSRLTEALVREEHFSNYVLENFPLVKRVLTVESYNAAVPIAATGHVSIFALKADGATLTELEKTEIETAVAERAHANLEIHIADPIIATVDVTYTVAISAGYSALNVEEACDAAISLYLSADSGNWGTTLRLYEMIALLSAVPGVEYVSELTFVPVSPAEAALDGPEGAENVIVSVDHSAVIFVVGTITSNTTTP